MSTNITPISGETKLDIEADKVIVGSLEAGLTDVLVLGYRPDDSLYIAMSQADAAHAVWLLEKAKQAILESTE